MITQERLLELLTKLRGKLTHATTKEEIRQQLLSQLRLLLIGTDEKEIESIVDNLISFDPIDEYINDDNVEDIIINNTRNVFVYKKGKLEKKPGIMLGQLELLVSKFLMYATSEVKPGLYDIHLPNGSRVNAVRSPYGYEVAIRNFKKIAPSIIDLVNLGTLDYSMAAKIWLYADGFGIRPANMLIGGMPGSGKTTLLNAMFSFFKPEERIVVIEDTLELNTSMLENCARLETTKELDLEDLVQNVLRMRPDRIIIGEVRGREALDMMTAMNIGKIGMSTIHGSSARDIVTRLENAPMYVPKHIIPLIDSIIVMAKVTKDGSSARKVVEMAEVSGIETDVLLNQIYRFDFKQGKSIETNPSVSYRDTLSRLSGRSNFEIIKELELRERILIALSKKGIHKIEDVSAFVKEYYDNPSRALAKIDLQY